MDNMLHAADDFMFTMGNNKESTNILFTSESAGPKENNALYHQSEHASIIKARLGN